MNLKLVGIVPCFNESSRGNLRRCLDNMRHYCDEIVVHDDASEDDSVQVAKEYTPHVIEGKTNNFANETQNRDALLQYAIRIGASYVFWLDADECLDRAGAEGGLRELMYTGRSYSFEEVTLWRSQTWRRLDYLGRGRFIRLWNVMGNVVFIPHTPGLHKQLYPCGLGEVVFNDEFKVLHYGYSTQEAIERRWRERTAHGVPTSFRSRGVNEQEMVLEKVPLSWFPPGIDVPENEPMPTPIRFAEDIMKEAGWPLST